MSLPEDFPELFRDQNLWCGAQKEAGDSPGVLPSLSLMQLLPLNMSPSPF